MQLLHTVGNILRFRNRVLYTYTVDIPFFLSLPPTLIKLGEGDMGKNIIKKQYSDCQISAIKNNAEMINNNFDCFI